MSLFDSYWVSIFAGFSAFMLGLCILVQVIQEIFKYLTNSKARAYTRALQDYLGLDPAKLEGIDSHLMVRKPWPFKAESSKTLLLPMEKDRLFAALIKLGSDQGKLTETDIQSMSDRHSQFVANFEYAYKRRNLSQTFVIALTLALIFNFSVGRLYQKASALSPEDAAALAEKYVNIYKEMTAKPESESEELRDEKTAENLAALKQNALAIVAAAPAPTAPPSLFVDAAEITSSLRTFILYLLGCLMTASLVCFGAPVWNDLASLFFRLQKGKNGANDGSDGGENETTKPAPPAARKKKPRKGKKKR